MPKYSDFCQISDWVNPHADTLDEIGLLEDSLEGNQMLYHNDCNSPADYQNLNKSSMIIGCSSPQPDLDYSDC